LSGRASEEWAAISGDLTQALIYRLRGGRAWSLPTVDVVTMNYDGLFELVNARGWTRP